MSVDLMFLQTMPQCANPILDVLRALHDMENEHAKLLTQLQQNITLQANYIKKIESLSTASCSVLQFLQKHWHSLHLARSVLLLRRGQYLMSFLMTADRSVMHHAKIQQKMAQYLLETKAVQQFEAQIQPQLHHLQQARKLGRMNEITYLKNLYFCYTGQKLTSNPKLSATAAQILARLRPRGE
jgi:hypothetical protein